MKRIVTVLTLAAMTAGYSAIPVSYAQTRVVSDLEVENASDTNIVRVYVRVSRSSGWGKALPDTVIPAEKTVTIKAPSDSCTYDFRFEFVDGRREEHFKVDVCTPTHITVGEKKK